MPLIWRYHRKPRQKLVVCVKQNILKSGSCMCIGRYWQTRVWGFYWNWKKLICASLKHNVCTDCFLSSKMHFCKTTQQSSSARTTSHNEFSESHEIRSQWHVAWWQQSNFGLSSLWKQHKFVWLCCTQIHQFLLCCTPYKVAAQGTIVSSITLGFVVLHHIRCYNVGTSVTKIKLNWTEHFLFPIYINFVAPVE